MIVSIGVSAHLTFSSREPGVSTNSTVSGTSLTVITGIVTWMLSLAGWMRFERMSWSLKSYSSKPSSSTTVEVAFSMFSVTCA